MNAKVSFGDAQTGGFSATEEVSGENLSGVSNKPREKRVKGPNAER